MKLKSGFLRNSLFLLFLTASLPSFSQGNGTVVDQVASIVGGNIILRSEVEAQYQQLLQSGTYGSADLKCRILDQLLLNKLLLEQAKIDSLEVTDDKVNQNIDNRLQYYISQLGSVEKLEEFYGKSVPEMKNEFRPLVREQLLSQQMQQKIISGITASPADVKAFYEAIPKDSLPLINAEVEYAQIIKEVKITDAQKKIAKDKLTDIRERILKGEDFSTLAVLYSEDVASARQGGELGFVNRGDLVPTVEAAAFRMKNTHDISEIVESPYGYHIIQLIERRGEKINVRHILIKATVTPEELVNAQQQLDSVATAIKAGTIKFAAAAEKYSDDKDTKFNGGQVMNPNSGASKFETSQVDPAILFTLDKLNPGEISVPQATTTNNGAQCYRILFLKSRSEPHSINMKDDYQRLQEAAQNDKQAKMLEAWKNKKKATTYIKIADEYKDCAILKDWMTP